MFIGTVDQLQDERQRILTAYYNGSLDGKETLSQLNDIDKSIERVEK